LEVHHFVKRRAGELTGLSLGGEFPRNESANWMKYKKVEKFVSQSRPEGCTSSKDPKTGEWASKEGGSFRPIWEDEEKKKEQTRRRQP